MSQIVTTTDETKAGDAWCGGYTFRVYKTHSNGNPFVLSRVGCILRDMKLFL